MARRYRVRLPATAFTVAVDLFELTPADDKPIRVIETHLFQTTELGDAAEEQIGLDWVRGHTTSGSGGSAATPQPVNPNDTAAGCTAEVGNTTAATLGTTTTHGAPGWNVRIPYADIRPNGRGVEATQANTTLVLRMAAAPADSITIGGHVIVEEEG